MHQDKLFGRNRVLAQLHAVRDPAEVGTMAILKGKRTCKQISMYMEIYIYICICIYVYKYVYIYIYMFV